MRYMYLFCRVKHFISFNFFCGLLSGGFYAGMVKVDGDAFIRLEEPTNECLRNRYEI